MALREAGGAFEFILHKDVIVPMYIVLITSARSIPACRQVDHLYGPIHFLHQKLTA